MNVLVACEESQRVCTAFRERGHTAWSCDILPCSGGHPEWHIQNDVIKLIRPDVLLCSFDHDIPDEMWGDFKTQDGKIHELPCRWDLIIAHPPLHIFEQCRGVQAVSAQGRDRRSAVSEGA